MVRGSLPLMAMLHGALTPGNGYVKAAIITGIIVMAISTFAAIASKETFGKDLDYVE